MSEIDLLWLKNVWIAEIQLSLGTVKTNDKFWYDFDLKSNRILPLLPAKQIVFL